MSELPRLLFCCFDVVPGPSAISRRLTEYIKGLSERFQVVVLSAKTPDHPHIERYHGARLLRVPVGSGDLPSRSQTFDRAVRRQLESEEYGLVHFFDPFAGYALCERRSELGYRLVYDACTFPSVELPLENAALASNRRFVARVRRQELFCLMNADGVVVGSPLTADYVAGLGVDRGQVRVLRAPIDLEPFKPELMGRPDATPMKVLHLGRATRGQGIELLLEAMHVALQTVDVRLTLVSPKNPEAQARLEQLVAERKLTGKVEFQDPVGHDDVHKVLATADVGALTLDDVERNQVVGTPLARLGEYLAAGRPVIAADVAAVRALLPAEGAVLYRAGDAGSLADALVQLATDTARRVRLGAAARAAAADWDSARIRLELVKLYADVTGATAEAVRDVAADPYEPTQMGRAPSDSGEVTQLRGRAADDSSVGTNKVKTDPAIAASTDSSTDAAARADRPAIMGVPLREDAPAEVARQAVTEPGARQSTEPPVVMGSPLRDAGEGPVSPATVARALEDAGPAGTASAPPVPDELPPASFDDELRTDLRAPAEVLSPPGPMPSVPTVPEAVDPTSPFAAPAPPVFVPPLAELPKPILPDEDEPFLPGLIATSPPKPGPPIPTGSSPGVAAPASVAALRGAPTRAAPESVATTPVAPVTPSAKTDTVPPVPPAASARTDVVPPVPPPVANAPAIATPTEGPPPIPPRRSAAPFAVAPDAAAPATRPSSTGLPAVALKPPSPASLPAMAPPPVPSTRPSSTGLPAVTLPPVPKPASQQPPVPSSRPSSTGLPAVTLPPPLGPPAIPALAEDEVAEIDADEVMDVEEPSDTGDEIMEADEAIQTVDTDASPPPSALDPWLAQLVHGYCPPESHLFDRHTPPTTMPGRDT